MEVNQDTLGVDVIKEVGPGGNFLSHEHTLKYLRKVRWFPGITNREKWEQWESKGSKDMRQRAKEGAERILKEHHPQYLSQEVSKEIDRMAIKAQKEVVARSKK